MAGGTATVTDTRLGYSILLGFAVVAGAAMMLIQPGELTAAAGFALAILAGVVLVTAIHLPGE